MKIHLLADERCRPLAGALTAGQRHDSVAFEAVMANLRVRRVGCGRPRTRPDRMLADKAYSNRLIRGWLRRHGVRTTIPQPADQIAARRRRGARGGRPPAFDRETYKQRNIVERAINKLRATRAVATRYDKREYVYLGNVDVASIRIWLRDPPRVDSRDTP
jgi:transposase